MKCTDMGDRQDAISSICFPSLIYRFFVSIVFALSLLIDNNTLFFLEIEDFCILYYFSLNFLIRIQQNE